MQQYQPLYLKYRPQKLSGVIGQEVVTKTLSNAVLYNKIVHAYLFCGPRGTGKTSTARILAKSLNCEGGISLEPCGKCTSCQSITNGNSLDVIEIDAASHRKVEDAEDLINRVSLGTYGSRFKIYIIDEVHMLTDHAFNTLLKTLEEPPKNVIFILATTEEYKIIPTIISRCQKLNFKPVVQNEIEKRIKEIAKLEKINIDNSVLEFISKRSLGCLRDAVSLLDQISVLQVDDKPINPEEVFELFGTVDRISLFKLVESLLTFNKLNAVQCAEDLVKSGKDISELFKGLLELIIDLAKAQINSEYKKILGSELGNNLSILNSISQNHVLKIIDRLQDSQSKLRFALSQELQFMVEIMSMLDEDFLLSLTELSKRVENLEKGKPKSAVLVEHPKKEEHKLRDEEKEVTQKELEKDEPDISVVEDYKKQFPGSLDVLWGKTIGFIDSNPTKTLLLQSDSYLLNVSGDLLEIGLSKDMFLPRLEADAKKKELILKAANLASGMNMKNIRFRILPRKLQELKISEDDMPAIQKEKGINGQENVKSNISNKGNKILISEGDNEFSKSIKDLLGARQIE